MLGPLVAVLGLLAAFIAVRTRWRVRQSLYESLRTERRRQVEQARGRVVAGDGPPLTPPPELAEPREIEVAEETFMQKVAAQLALVGALLAILLGVLLLIAAAR